MGAEQSGERYGWRVLKVMPNSPCAGKGLVPYFHLMTHVNGVELSHEEDTLINAIVEGKKTTIRFFDIRFVCDSVC